MAAGRRVVLELLAVAGLLVVAACVAGEPESHDDTFRVGAPPVLTVENGNGDITIR